MLSLILMGGVLATTAYAAKTVVYDNKMRNNRHTIEKLEQDNSRINVIHEFENIIQMCDIKRKDGVLPKDGWKRCDDFILCNFTNNTEEDLYIFNKHYNEVRTRELNNKKADINNEYKITAEIINNYNKYLTDTSRWEVRHWWGLTRQEHEKRIEKLYNNTVWKELVTSKAKLIPDPINTAFYMEIWNIKHIPKNNASKYAKRNDFAIFESLTFKGIQNIYSLCCKEIDLESGFKYNPHKGLVHKDRVANKTSDIQNESLSIIKQGGYKCYCGRISKPNEKVCPKCKRNLYIQCQMDLSMSFAMKQASESIIKRLNKIK